MLRKVFLCLIPLSALAVVAWSILGSPPEAVALGHVRPVRATPNKTPAQAFPAGVPTNNLLRTTAKVFPAGVPTNNLIRVNLAVNPVRINTAAVSPVRVNLGVNPVRVDFVNPTVLPQQQIQNAQ